MMRTDEVRKLTKDIVVMFEGHQCLLHPCNGMIYLLSDLKQYDGSTCSDLSQYRGKYRYSFWLVNKDDSNCDGMFAEICRQLIPHSLGGL